PRGSKSAEMIEADHVDLSEQRPCPVDPPAIAACPKRVPVVDGIAPTLAVRAEVVGRHAGDGARPTLLVEQEQLRVGPHIARVGGDEERKVADQLHASGSRVSLQARALTEQQELSEANALDLVRVIPSGALEGDRRAPHELLRPLQVAG